MGRPDAVSLWFASRDGRPDVPGGVARLRATASSVLAIDAALRRARALLGDPSRPPNGPASSWAPLAVYASRRCGILAAGLLAWRAHARALLLEDVSRLAAARRTQLAALADSVAAPHEPADEDEPGVSPLVERILRALGPSWTDRLSLRGVLFVSLGAAAAVHVSGRYAEAPQFVYAAYSAGLNLFLDWIVTPLREIWRTVRFTRSVAAETSAAASLDADRRALGALMAPYDSPEAFAAHFARCAQRPWRGILSGQLLTLLLIEAQRAKIDVGAALLATDRLLHSNALTFELVALLPVLGAVYLAARGAAALFSRCTGRTRRRAAVRIRSVLADTERLLLSSMGSTATILSSDSVGASSETIPLLPDARDAALQGELLVSVQRVLDLWHGAETSAALSAELYADLSALLADVPPVAKVLTLQRMLSRSPYFFAYV